MTAMAARAIEVLDIVGLSMLGPVRPWDATQTGAGEVVPHPN
jgi:hypothetical protein